MSLRLLRAVQFHEAGRQFGHFGGRDFELDEVDVPRDDVADLPRGVVRVSAPDGRGGRRR